MGAYDITTLSGIKEMYGAPLSVKDTEDTFIQSLITGISVAMETYCNRKFVSRAYTEYHTGNDSNNLFPYNTPIVSVTGLYIDSDWSWSSSTLVNTSDYRVVDNKYIYYKYSFVSYPQAIKLIYTAGYTTIPADLELVARQEVIRHYKQRTDPQVISKTLSNGETISYSNAEFLPTTLSILKKYRRLSVC